MKMARGTQLETTSKTSPRLSVEFLFPTQDSSSMVLTRLNPKPEMSDGFAESLSTTGPISMPASRVTSTPTLRESYILNGIGPAILGRTVRLRRGGFIDTLLIATRVSDSVTRLTTWASLQKFP